MASIQEMLTFGIDFVNDDFLFQILQKKENYVSQSVPSTNIPLPRPLRSGKYFKAVKSTAPEQKISIKAKPYGKIVSTPGNILVDL